MDMAHAEKDHKNDTLTADLATVRVEKDQQVTKVVLLLGDVARLEDSHAKVLQASVVTMLALRDTNLVVALAEQNVEANREALDGLTEQVEAAEQVLAKAESSGLLMAKKLAAALDRERPRSIR
jgi:hypothetical protein